MCGIFGLYSFTGSSGAAFGPEALVEVLLNGLERLEYRGYDSAGLGVDIGVGPGANLFGSGISVVKEQVGRGFLLDVRGRVPKKVND